MWKNKNWSEQMCQFLHIIQLSIISFKQEQEAVT